MDINLIFEIIRIFFSNKGVEPEEDFEVDPFIEELKEFKEKREQLFYKISKTVEKGVIVRTIGINGFISYNQMPWTYADESYWRIMEPYLKHERFVGIIRAIADYKRPFIILNGKIHQFSTTTLTFVKNHTYDGIVLSKTKEMVQFELGHGFKWEYGSLMHSQHRTLFSEEDFFDSIKIGDVISVIFRGYYSRTALFSDKPIDNGWLNGEIDLYVNTVQKFKITRSVNGEREYWLNDRFKGILPVNQLFYPEHYLNLSDHLATLKTGDLLACEISMTLPNNLTVMLRLTNEFLKTLKPLKAKEVSLLQPYKFLSMGEGKHKYTIVMTSPMLTIWELNVQVDKYGIQIIDGLAPKIDPFTPTKVYYSDETDPGNIIKELKKYEFHLSQIEEKREKQKLPSPSKILQINQILRNPEFLKNLAMKIRQRLPNSTRNNNTIERSHYVFNPIYIIRLSEKGTYPEYGEWWNDPFYNTRRCLAICLSPHKKNAQLQVNSEIVNFGGLKEITSESIMNRVAKVLEEMGLFHSSY